MPGTITQNSAQEVHSTFHSTAAPWRMISLVGSPAFFTVAKSVGNLHPGEVGSQGVIVLTQCSHPCSETADSGSKGCFKPTPHVIRNTSNTIKEHVSAGQRPRLKREFIPKTALSEGGDQDLIGGVGEASRPSQKSSPWRRQNPRPKEGHTM